MITVRGLVLLAFAWGASASSSGSSHLSTQQLRSLRAGGGLAQERFQPPVGVADDAHVTEALWFQEWITKGSGFLRSAPLPGVVKQLFGAFSSESLRAEQDVVDQSAHQQVFLMLLYWLIYVLWILLFIGLWVALFAVVGYFYTKNKEYAPVEESLATPEQQATFKDWKFGFCSCLEDCEVCWCAWCCPCIRWGETLSLVDGLIVFWVGFGVYLGLTVLSWVTYIPLCWLLLTVICTAYRQEIRIKFQMQRVGGMTYITDCLLYAFCACCAMSQEARHVEAALKYGHKVVRVPERE